MLNIEAKNRLETEFSAALECGVLKKAVLSKPCDRAVLKTVLTPFTKNGTLSVKSETFLRDGKAIQAILSVPEATALLISRAGVEFRQINLVGDGSGLELLISEKGKTRFTGSLENAKSVEISSGQDSKKVYTINPETDGDFLKVLGICDAKGKIHDKKQSKYRQINKFIEQIEAVEQALPNEGDLCICDLCCGKSYLTFAVYRYFTHHKKRRVKMYGVDLKPDVIAYCSDAAKRLGYVGMHFECGDVSRFSPPQKPDLVISLHACDIATDFAIAGAIKQGARVILSTPCCQHEINRQIKCSELDFLLEHSILKQKVSAAVTDALRAKILEIHGYAVTVCELIDPEETPKNVLIRAVKSERRLPAGKRLEELKSACELLSVEPTLMKLLGM